MKNYSLTKILKGENMTRQNQLFAVNEIAEIARNVLKRRREKNHYDCPVCNGKVYISKANDKITCVSNRCEGIFKEILSLSGQSSTWEAELPEPIVNGNGLSDKHYEEFANSGISAEIVDENFAGCDHSATIADFLGWKYWQNGPGWIVRSYHPKTGQLSNCGQFKPDIPMQLPDWDKPAKYLSQKSGYDAICLKVPGINWQEAINDSNIPIYICEGAKKAIAWMLKTGQPCLALPGVTMWHQKDENDRLVPNLEIFVTEGRKFPIIFDADIVSKASVKNEVKKLGTHLIKRNCEVDVITWDISLGKGIDDFLMNPEADMEKLQTLEYDQWLALQKQLQKKSPLREFIEPRKVPEDVMSCELAEIYRDQLAYDSKFKVWYRYGAIKPGIWSIEPEEFVKLLFMTHMKAKNIRYTNHSLSAVCSLVKNELSVHKFNETQGKLPFINGVLDVATGIFESHSQKYHLTWCLPYEYQPAATCEPIIDWLKSALKHDDQVELIRAFFACIVRGRNDLQKFLELIGPGGTGKSTLLKLAVCLVGIENNHVTHLQKLEGSRFETASIKNKLLVQITDSDRYGGGLSNFKALTAGESLHYERKFKQSTCGFLPRAMVMMASNEPIQSSDYTSGLLRRKITVYMNQQIDESEQRSLIEVSEDSISGEFAQYIPGLLNWVMAMPIDQVEYYIKRTSEAVPSLADQKINNLLSINPIADWADLMLIICPNNKVNVGLAQRNLDRTIPKQFINTEKWLYASYCEFMEASNNKPVSGRRFTSLLDDLLRNQLKLKNISHKRDRTGSFFLGIALRREANEEECLFSGDNSQITTLLPKSLQKLDKSQTVTASPDSLSPKTLVSDGLEKYDGSILLIDKLVEKFSNDENINLKNFQDHPSQPLPVSLSAIKDDVSNGLALLKGYIEGEFGPQYHSETLIDLMSNFTTPVKRAIFQQLSQTEKDFLWKISSLPKEGEQVTINGQIGTVTHIQGGEAYVKFVLSQEEVKVNLLDLSKSFSQENNE